MPVIIDEIQVDVATEQPGTDEAAAPQPTEAELEARMMRLLELARERAERLSCD